MAKKKINKPELFNQDYQKEWSETHKYKHIHTGEHCTFEAYVAEYIVLRRAESSMMENHHINFGQREILCTGCGKNSLAQRFN